MTHRLLTTMILALALQSSAGCGDDGSALQGIYTIDTWTENLDGCDTEGDSILETQFATALYLKDENFLGIEFLNGVLCEDVAECVELSGDEDTIHLGEYNFESGNDDDGYHDSGCSAFCDGGLCDGDYLEVSLTSETEGVVRFETRRTAIVGVPADEDGFCDDDTAADAAADEPCTSLEVITASFDSDI